MAGLDVSRLAPSDCVAALRSYPRRFRAAVADISGEEQRNDIAHRAGPDGRSALDITAAASSAIAMLGDALRAALVTDSPTLPAAVLDPSKRAAASAVDSSADSVLAQLERECERLADTVGHTDADDWGRKVEVEGGTQVNALDVVREAVRTGAEALRAAEAAMQHARHNR